MSDETNEPSGYKNPPRHGQWVKGQSGNPQGARKRRPKSAQEAARAALERKDKVVKDGRRQNVSTIEAVFEVLTSAALKGVPAAQRILFNYLKENPSVVTRPIMLRQAEPGMTTQERADLYAETLKILPEYLRQPMDEIDFGPDDKFIVDDE